MPMIGFVDIAADLQIAICGNADALRVCPALALKPAGGYMVGEDCALRCVDTLDDKCDHVNVLHAFGKQSGPDKDVIEALFDYVGELIPDKLVLSTYGTSAYRKIVSDIFFESYSGLELLPQQRHILATYGLGRTCSAAAIDLSQHQTTVAAVHEGSIVTNSMSSGIDIEGFSLLEDCVMKHNIPCAFDEKSAPFVSEQYKHFSKQRRVYEYFTNRKDSNEIILPDGTQMDEFTKPYFNPSSGLAEGVTAAIKAAKCCLNQEMLSSVILFGDMVPLVDKGFDNILAANLDNTIFGGLGFLSEKFWENQIKLKRNTMMKCWRVISSKESVRTGGSIIGSIDAFSDWSVTKSQYQEHGSDVWEHFAW